jgi:tRNA pseudouridine13 synthase
LEAGLPYLTAGLAGVACTARERPVDFAVEELPAYAPSGQGDHVYFAIEKVGLSTRAAIERLAAALDVAPRAIGFAGLKDARAVARQVLSLEHADPERVAGLELERLRVLWVDRHRNKLRRGHLRGNRFALRLRGAAVEREADVRAVLAVLEAVGVPNYFGEQRFGLRGDNWRVGRALLERDWAAAAAWLAGRPGEGDRPAVRRARELFDAGEYGRAARAWPGQFRSAVRLARAMQRHGGDARAALRAVGGEELRFAVSAYQALLFDRVLAARLAQGTLAELLLGDLAWRHANGAVFRVEDPDRERPRALALEVSPSGPLFGRRMTAPGGEPGSIEVGVLAAEGLSEEALRGRGPYAWKGARRPLRVPLGEPSCAAAEDARGPYLGLAFALPPGAYATAVLREITKREPVPDD